MVLIYLYPLSLQNDILLTESIQIWFRFCILLPSVRYSRTREFLIYHSFFVKVPICNPATSPRLKIVGRRISSKCSICPKNCIPSPPELWESAYLLCHHFIHFRYTIERRHLKQKRDKDSKSKAKTSLPISKQQQQVQVLPTYLPWRQWKQHRHVKPELEEEATRVVIRLGLHQRGFHFQGKEQNQKWKKINLWMLY